MTKSKWLEENRTRKAIKKFISKKLIPLDVNVPEQLGQNKEYYIKFLEVLGFKNIKIVSNFIKADFPIGWKYKVFKETFPFFYLIDNKLRKRASIYLSTTEFLGMEENEKEITNKVQFIAFINWMPRYVYRIREEKNYAYGEVFDNGTEKVIYKTKLRLISDKVDKTDKKYHIDKKNLYNLLEEECIAYLNLHYPNYNNILEYWENKNYIYEDEKRT